MSRIAATFARLGARKALIPFITAGDPHPDRTVELMRALVEGGADILELGVPFSDPMADGPVIQRAAERALAHKVRLLDVLAMVRSFRERDSWSMGRRSRNRSRCAPIRGGDESCWPRSARRISV